LEATPDLEVVSSPAVAGPAGDEIVVVGSMAGSVYAPRRRRRHRTLVLGHRRVHLRVGSHRPGPPSSSAVPTGSSTPTVLGGGSSAAPAATITAPADNSTVANPNGKLAVSGTAADDVGVPQGPGGRGGPNVGGNWWDAAHRVWTKTFTLNKAQLTAAGARHHRLGALLPPPTRDGGGYYAQAEAIDRDGQAHRRPWPSPTSP